ncbi:MAG: biotin--[acetyl-CoA-carboxylase] ligase [Syntrophaceae bacterium]|nr:biotin--[acetyl-CoA-carboxylase] ligase [Syntrophaceae bacterium]
MELCLKELKKELAGEIIGHSIHYFQEIGSTNDEAFRLGMDGAPEGTVVVADSQSAGKGRLQRSWFSPPQANIYTSIILRPEFNPADAPRITIMAGLAAAQTIETYCPREARIKWPNDVLLDGKKVCGILAQMQTNEDKIDFVILGIGINVNIAADDFPAEIRKIATSLAAQTGAFHSRHDLLITLYKNLSKWYKTLISTGFEMISDEWLRMASLIGCKIQVKFGNEIIKGKAVGIDERGALVMSDSKGKTVKILAGDASILKEN